MLDGVQLVGKHPTEICQAGVARTFQNIRLFSKMTVLFDSAGRGLECFRHLGIQYLGDGVDYVHIVDGDDDGLS